MVNSMQRELETLRAECLQLQAETACDVCAGKGMALSGPCICNGTGKAFAAVNALRQQVYDLRAKCLKLQVDRDFEQHGRLELIAKCDSLMEEKHKLRESLSACVNVIEKRALQLDQEPGNQIAVSSLLHLMTQARAVLANENKSETEHS